MPSTDYQWPIETSTAPHKSAIDTWQMNVALVAAVSFAVIIPTVLWGIPSNLDLTNHFRFALPFYDAIASGNVYPSWLAESNGGYGDPSFRFYPPAFYYLLAAARFLIGNWYDATLVAFIVVSIVGGLGIYFWARSFLSPQTAAWAGFFYALAPYHINQLYQAAMLAEWAGSAVLPFVFAFVDRVCQRGKPRDIAGLAITYALLLFTHLPLAVIGSMALLVYTLVRLESPGKLLKLAKLSFGVVLGVSLSAVYWVTMIAEKDWIAADKLEPNSLPGYSNNFVLSALSPDNLTVWWVNILTLMTLLLCAPAVVFLFRNSSAPRRIVRPVIIVTAFALFMSLPLSWPIWRVLGPLQETQFPWRWLAIFSMGASIVAAAALPYAMSAVVNLDRSKRMLMFGAMAIAIAFTMSHSVREAVYFPRTKFDSMATSVRGTQSLNYWLPFRAQPNPRKMPLEVEIEGREVTVKSWQPEQRSFSIDAGTATEARIRTFYYPHWVATNETGILPTRRAGDGALLIELPQHATSVQLDFREPARTKVSTTVSLSGLIIVGGLLLPFRWKRKT
jgi:uncharacterized membrane protein